jgi:hypothetical protein
MRLLRCVASLLAFTLGCGLAQPLWAQRVPDAPAVARLRVALRRPASAAPVADSLLAQARQLGYVPGQVVALAQLASIRLQAKLPEQATPLLQEAEQLASQVHSSGEVSWMTGQVGSILQRLARRAPEAVNSYDALFQALDAARRKSTVAMPESPALPDLAELKNIKNKVVKSVLVDIPTSAGSYRSGRLR